MPCVPIESGNIIAPPVGPSFGGLTVPQLPTFDLPFPALPLEDLLNIFNKLNMILPSGTLRPNLSVQFSKNILDGILSILEKFVPFLMLYTFFMPILNMILCIIEVLCAINNPFKLIRTIVRLFRVCIPEFLALFPFFAIILMIISLLLLIIALILYLIQRIIDFIKQIIENIILIGDAIQSADNDSVIAIVAKLGDLLCVLQNLFVLFGVIILIVQIIQRLLNLDFRIPPCDDNDGSDDGCCTPDVCPSFIKNNKQIASVSGTLQYFNEVISTSGGLISTVVRKSSFQLYDASASVPLSFNNITHAFDLPAGFIKVFFPESEIYTKNTTPNSVPYTVDLRLFYNPAAFGRTDVKGARFIRINNCIVLSPPVDGVLDYQNSLIAPFNGTLSLGGGTAFEDDGITIMKANENDAGAGSLETVILIPNIVLPTPILTPFDGVKFTPVTYTFKVNHTVLISKTLITLGCHPDVALSKNAINTTIGAQFNINGDALRKIRLPDVQGAQECVVNAITKFRDSVSVESANELQDSLLFCLNNLQSQTNDALKDAIDAGFDPFQSDFTLDPAIQFTTRPIDVNVSLNESGGNSITSNLPLVVAQELASHLEANITLGHIGTFNYDGTGKFIAQIASKEAGNGKIKVAFNNKFISKFNNPTDITQSPSVEIKELTYTFVQSPTVGDVDGAVHHDESDIARTERG